jgi:murein DD-endopeptidase MepM/ murein hydrolase activator NlpD
MAFSQPLLKLLKSLVVLVLIVLTATGCAANEYRIPYLNGTNVTVLRDFVTHNSPSAAMYDIRAEQQSIITAAAAGWVRFIEDSNTISGSDVEDGQYGNNNYVWIEHPYPFCQNPNDPDRATWTGKPADYDQTCQPCSSRFCNEWTVYAHMSPGSVTGTGFLSAGLSVGDWVEAGQPIGIEDDIGFARIGRHLHWHVAVIDPDWTPSENGDYDSLIGNGNGRCSGRCPERIPLVCTANGRRVLFRNGSHTAAPCP